MPPTIILEEMTIKEVLATPAMVVKEGFLRDSLTAGDKVKVRVAHEEVLDLTVPSGKAWDFEFIVRIRETTVV